MSALIPTYRVALNKNLFGDVRFIWFLKQEFNRLITNSLLQGTRDLTTKYKFTIYSIPLQWGSYIIPKIKINEMLPSDQQDKKLLEISEILLKLDPVSPKSVDLEFELGQIVGFVKDNVGYFQETTSGGTKDYFGISTQMWFDDYPIQTGTILKAVDYGTLDNPPIHLFDVAISCIRETVLDLFAQFINNIKSEVPLQKVATLDVDI